MPELYVAEKPSKEGLEVRHPVPHRCPPKQIPYLVDNLWEWKRPEGFPDRRFSTIASPRLNLAGESAPMGAKIYCVEFIEGAVVAQAAIPDSRRHPDCRLLEDKVRSHIDESWYSKDAADKKLVGRLFIPCMSRDEIEEVFSKSVLSPARDDIWKAVTYWDDVQLVDPEADDWPDDDGEIFFTAESWRLQEM